MAGKRKPGWRDYWDTVSSIVTNTPGGAADIARSVPLMLGDARNYLTTRTGNQIGRDIYNLGSKAVRGVADTAKEGAHYVRTHSPSEVINAPLDKPLSEAINFLPYVGTANSLERDIRDAALARAEGRADDAYGIERVAGPTALMSLAGDVPLGKLLGAGVRKVKSAAATGAARTARALGPGRGGSDLAVHGRPQYHISEEGPYLNVRREGVEPQIIPEAQGANLSRMREILSNPETNPAERAAREYNRVELGRDLDTSTPYIDSTLQKQSGIGRVYDLATENSPAYQHAIFERYGQMFPELVEKTGAQNYNQLTEAAYNALGDKTIKQFDRLPVGMRYHSGEGEYGVPSQMMDDVLSRGNLNVYRGGDPHPFLGRIDPVTGLSLNEMFRATHDFYGHVMPGSTFQPLGEEIAYRAHSRTMDPLEQMALLSETRGQNSWVNYTPANADLYHQMAQLRDEREVLQSLPRDSSAFGQLGGHDRIRDINSQLREMGTQTKFAEQSPLLLPPEFLDPAFEGGIPNYLRPLIRGANPTNDLRGVHLSHTGGLGGTDPSFYGTGLRGRDWNLRGKKGSPKQHTSFYIGDQGTVVPEWGVSERSPYAYQTQLGGLYDINQDPDQLAKLARTYNIAGARKGNDLAHAPDLARLVDEYGYSGYYDPNFLGEGRGAANVFGPVEGLTPIERGPKGYAEGGSVSGPPVRYAAGGSVSGPPVVMVGGGE